jgi:hypothetical protein
MAACAFHKWYEKDHPHEQRTQNPGDGINLYNGKYFAKHLSQGQEEVGNIYQGVKEPNHGGGRIQPQGKKRNYVPCQESIRKGIEKVEDIIPIPGFTKTIRRE